MGINASANVFSFAKACDNETIICNQTRIKNPPGALSGRIFQTGKQQHHCP
jgi:hypothetical protein